MPMQESSDLTNVNESNDLNKLLLKCIELRNQIELVDANGLQKFHDQETVLKHKLVEKYYQLTNQKNHTDTLIEVELYIEKTLQSCREPIQFLCNPKWTIYTAKRKIIEKANLSVSPNNVLVISKNKIAKEWSTLETCGIQNNGDMLYVYISLSNNPFPVEPPQAESSSSDDFPYTKYLKLLSVSSNQPGTSRIETAEILQGSTPHNVSFENRGIFPTSSNQNISVSSSMSTVYQTVTTPSSSHNPNFSLGTPVKTNAIDIFEPRFSESNDDVSSSSSANTVIEVTSKEYNPNALASLFGEPVTKSISTTFNSTTTGASQISLGWTCTKCTYVNKPARPGCEICSSPRPENYKLPADYVPTAAEEELMKKQKESDEMFKKMQIFEEENRQQNYQNYVTAHQQNLLENNETLECSICMTEAGPGEAVKLADCLHAFCKECLSMHINLSDQLPVICPFVDDTYNCSSPIPEREIRSLLPEDCYQTYLQKSLSAAEKHVQNSFHCKTPDCTGWCEYDDGVNDFRCPVCNHLNCLTCKAIHETMDCREYQNELFNDSSNKQAKKTKKLLKKLVKKKEAMHCPDCNIILMKKEGCDWLQCTMCHLEICWVTQQPRWGPGGPGDMSGGCHCRENGMKCHPLCVNCH